MPRLTPLAVLLLVGPLRAQAAALPSIDTPHRSGARADGDAAVVVGIEEYAFVQAVPYAERDARAFGDFLVSTRGVPAQQVTTLVGGASREMILQAVRSAAGKVRPGGTLWFYFAGHGAASSRDGGRLLLGDDARRSAEAFESRGVRLSELRALASSEGVPTVAVIDACYGGASRSGEELLPGKRFAVPVYASEPDPNWTEWNAAGPDELSGPIEGAQHGAFTYLVVGALRGWADGEVDGRRDGEVSAEEGKVYVQRTLVRLGVSDQRPSLVTTDARTLVLSPRASERAPSFDSVIAVTPTRPTLTKEEPNRTGTHGYTMMALRPGTFTMGSDNPSDPDHVKPSRRVKLSHGFLLGVTEVTQGLWESVMGDNPNASARAVLPSGREVACAASGVNAAMPVSCIDWITAATFCNALSELDGLAPAYEIERDNVYWDPKALGYRLPTEAEWEYAARSGSSSDGSGADGSGRLSPAGSDSPTAWGLHDMPGSVSEWVWDRRGAYPRIPEVDPEGPMTGRHGVYRGGSFAGDAADNRALTRGWQATELYYDPTIGLRLARNLP